MHMYSTKAHRTQGRRWRALCVLLGVLALFAISCSADDDDAGSTESADTGPELVMDEEEAGSGEDEGDAESGDESSLGGESGRLPADDAGDGESEEAEAEAPAEQDGPGGDAGSSDTPSGLTPADLGRQIIYVATVDVEVDNVASAASQAKTVVAGLGGLLFSEDTASSGSDNFTTLEFKVRPEDFQDALVRLEGLGDLQSQRITADDVTERVVDLQSRISTAEVSVERLRDLLVAATELETVAALEQQLLGRETDLELLRGQLRTVQDQVDLATIFLTLREPEPPEVIAELEFEATFYAGADDGARCPGNQSFEADEGDPVTACIALTNTGNAAVGEIELEGTRSLDLRPRDFAFIDADSDLIMQPGEAIFAWASFDAPAGGSAGFNLSASAFDENGDRVRVNVAFVAVESVDATFVADDSLPGFTDGVSASWDFLKRLGEVLVLVAGGLLPFIWVFPITWLGLRWWRRRTTKTNPTAM